MAYKYITNNNLYDKQNYMYSEFRGTDFLKEYLASRQLACLNTCEGVVQTSDTGENNVTWKKLRDIYDKVNTGGYDKETVCEFDFYVKSFEVRKRLYTNYQNHKPAEEASFENYENYLLFADCLALFYEKTRCLKYYSCMLKVDDTLLSIQNKLEEVQVIHLRDILELEQDIFCHWCKEILGEVVR